MTTTPPPMPDRAGFIRASGDFTFNGLALMGGGPVYTAEQLQARDDQWMERIQKLEAEIAALKSDAERYRWLRNEGFAFADVDLGTDPDGENIVTYRIRFYLPEPAHMKFDDDEWDATDIDAAIDAARAALEKTHG